MLRPKVGGTRPVAAPGSGVTQQRRALLPLVMDLISELSASVGIARGFPRRVADGLGVARVDLMKAESKSRP